MEECLSCARGFCWECHLPDFACCLDQLADSVLLAAVSSTSPGRPWKPDNEVEDPRSTMRKRAQRILKETRDIEIGSPCEWRGLANVGGGRHPIVGCREGKVRHIHHGPDKDWYNNSPSNLSGICNYCHNRWHARNDNCYDPNLRNIPRPALEEELVLWNDGKHQPKLDHKDCESIMTPK